VKHLAGLRSPWVKAQDCKTPGNFAGKTLEEKREVLQSFIQKITMTKDTKMLIEYDFLCWKEEGSGDVARTAGVTHGSPLAWNAPRPGQG